MDDKQQNAPEIDEAYVQEILRDMPKGVSMGTFMNLCQWDVNGGWAVEVAEARRRYFTPTTQE
jgi:hypothetical protein